MAENHNHLVIMAGGVGSRFWPMSTEDKPKQFIDVLGVGRSLMQLTYDRFKGVCPAENVWVVTNAAYVETVAEQLPEIPRGNIPISATMVRQMMIDNDKEDWKRWVNPKIYPLYDEMREKLLEVERIKNE